jgi:uncharacterized protein YfkK (UPF0435 family)
LHGTLTTGHWSNIQANVLQCRKGIKRKDEEAVELGKWSEENVEYMYEQITRKLRMATGGSIKAGSIKQEVYEDLKDLYDIVMSKNSFSISEIDAITTELGNLRKG